MTFARANEARYRDLSSDGSATLQDRQQAESQAQAAAAQHKANSAALLGARQQVAILRAQVEQGEAQVARSKAALDAFSRVVSTETIGDGVTSVGIPIAIGVMVFTIIITAIYVRRANNTYDQLTAQILEEARK